MHKHHNSYLESTQTSNFRMTQSYPTTSHSKNTRKHRYSQHLNSARNTIDTMLQYVQDNSIMYNESMLVVGQTNNQLRSYITDTSSIYQTSSNLSPYRFNDQPLSTIIDKTDIYSNYHSIFGDIQQSQNIYKSNQSGNYVSTIIADELKTNRTLLKNKQKLFNQNQQIRETNQNNISIIIENQALKQTIKQLTINQQQLRNGLYELQQLKKQNQQLRVQSCYLINKLR